MQNSREQTIIPGGIGLELLKPPEPPKIVWSPWHLWINNSNPGRALFIFLLLELISAAFACIFGISAINIGNNLLDATSKYKTFSTFYVVSFTSLTIHNQSYDSNSVGGYLFWGSIINGIITVIGSYFCLAGLGAKKQKPLVTYSTIAILNGCGYLALGLLSISLGCLVGTHRSDYEAACGRITNPSVSNDCMGAVDQYFDDLRDHTLGGSIPMLFCGTVLFINALLSHFARLIFKPPAEPEQEEAALSPFTHEVMNAQSEMNFSQAPSATPHWVEVLGQTRVEPGVGTANVVMPDPNPYPDNVGKALQQFQNTPLRVDPPIDTKVQEMVTMGEHDFAEQYRQAMEQQQRASEEDKAAANPFQHRITSV